MESVQRRVRLFLNASSGSSTLEPAEVKALFANHGCMCEVTEVGPNVDVASLAASDCIEIAFIAAGGDGTVNAVANALAGSERRMGVLPVGTLNHFAKDSGLPLTLEDAVAVAAGTTSRQVDVAQVQGEGDRVVFVNNSSLGFYPGMVSVRERMKKGGWNKWASLVMASIRAFIRFRCAHVELELNGERKRCTTPFLFVGNNRYCMEGTALGKRDCLDEGRLSLYLAPGATRIGMLRLALAALLGRVRSEPEYEEYAVTKFSVRTRHRLMRVSLDGEVRRMAGPLHYRILPKALHLLCTPDCAT